MTKFKKQIGNGTGTSKIIRSLRHPFFKETQLLEAAKKGRKKSIERILDAGVDVNFQDENGNTPLHYVAQNGCEECIEVLLKATNIQVDIKNNQGEIPYDLAKAKNFENIKKKLKAKKQEQLKETLEELGLRKFIATEADTVIKSKLLKSLANGPPIQFDEDLAIQMIEVNGYFPSYWNLDTYLYPLLQKRPDLADKLVYNFAKKYTILPPEAAEKLKRKRRNPEEGTESLFDAIKSNNLFAVNGLLNAGVQVNVQDRYGLTPLHEAARNGREACVRLLLAVPGVNVNEKDIDGDTPLHFAALYGHEACVKLLLAAPGINVNEKDDDGLTALHWAAWGGKEACVSRLLVAPGINVNEKDNRGRTPLYLAIMDGKEACVRRLLDAPGIDVKIESNDHKTALQLAKNKDIENLIREKLKTLEQSQSPRTATRNTALKRASSSTMGGKAKAKAKITKEYVTYSGKKYVVRIGSKGGRYILVGADKKKIYLK